MRPSHVLSAAALFGIAVLAATLIVLQQAPSKRPVSSGAPAVLSSAVHSAEAESRAAAGEVRRYALEYRHEVSVDGQPVSPTTARGVWTVEALSGGRLAASLTSAHITGLPGAPEPQEGPLSLQLATAPDGHLDRLGFAPAISKSTRGLLATLACSLWFTPGEGAQWTVEEEDRTGRYQAAYERRGDEITRRKVRYLALRGKEGLRADGTARVTVEGATRFLVRPTGLVEVTVDERLHMVILEGAPKVDVHVEASLRLVGSDKVALRAQPLYPLAPPPPFAEDDGTSAREGEEALLGNATLPDLLRALESVRDIEPGSAEERAWRTGTFLRLRALLRLSPAAASDVGEALKARVNDDPRVISVLAGSLGAAATPESTAALVALSRADLPASVELHVVTALGLGEPTQESVQALIARLDDPETGSTSALALGTEAGNLASKDPTAATSAIEELLTRYATATTPEERRLYLSALANTGSPLALPAMRAALYSDDLELAWTAAYGLRFIPGPEVEALLLELLSPEVPDAMKLQALRAIAFRSPVFWRDPLIALAKQPTTSAPVRAAIQGVLGDWPS